MLIRGGKRVFIVICWNGLSQDGIVKAVTYYMNPCLWFMLELEQPAHCEWHIKKVYTDSKLHTLLISTCGTTFQKPFFIPTITLTVNLPITSYINIFSCFTFIYFRNILASRVLFKDKERKWEEIESKLQEEHDSLLLKSSNKVMNCFTFCWGLVKETSAIIRATPVETVTKEMQRLHCQIFWY